MELVLEVTSEERHLLGDNASKSFRAVGGVIGRHTDCDWSIPDQKRHLSSRHAVVSCEDDGFHITDVSTNGVFINGAEKPLGRERSFRLSDADRISMGNMDFVVRLMLNASDHPFKSQSDPDLGGAVSKASNLIDPIALFKKTNGFEVSEEKPSASGITNLSKMEQVISAPDHRPAANVAFEPPSMLPDDWLADPAASIERKPKSQDRPKPTPAPTSEPISEPKKVESVSQSEQQLVSAFFKGLGVSPEILKKVDANQVMFEMGACLKANMNGMVALMQQRAQLKNEFRMDMTLVKAKGNNPLKFSADAKQAMKHLFKPEVGAFLSLNESFSECYQDMQMHQVAILAGAQASLRSMFDELSPDRIENKVEDDRTGITMSSKPSRCWHRYRSHHQELQNEDDIYNRLFNDAFVTAYEEHMYSMKESCEGDAS